MNRQQLAATTDPGVFAAYASGGTWHTADHLDYILDRLRAVAAGNQSRVEVFAPPRHGKSELLKYFVAWHLGRFPDKTVIVASYNDDLAADFGRAVRSILNAHGKELFGVELAADSSAVNRFQIANHAGGLYAVGVGGSMTGRGADLMILDDVIKSDVEALSETTQRRHWNWWRSVVLTRLHPDAAIVAVGTRWSVDDLLGRLADSGTFDVVRLPRLAEDDDPIGREPGDALWPAMFPSDVLKTIRTEQGGFWFSAMYRGIPEPVSGNMFPRDLFREYTETAESYQLSGTTIPTEDCVRFAIADTALSDKRTADYTVVAMFALTPKSELLLLERWRGRYSGPEQVKLMRRVCDEWNPAYLGIEAATPGLHTIQELQDTLPIRLLKPQGSKVARATTAATYLEQGKIWFPKKPWRDEWDAELVTFPHSKHDDQVDVLAYAALQIHKRRRVSLAGWTIDPGLRKPPSAFGFYPDRSQNVL
jgi:predicted phage terminase large subunit-like protein